LTAKLDEFYDLVHIDAATLKHSDIGDFALPANPKKSKLPEAMKSGGHGQSNIDELNRLGKEFKIMHTYKNGVRIGNVKYHKASSKRLGTGQSWFPKDWDIEKIKRAGQFVIQNNIIEFKKIADGKLFLIHLIM
jgi:Bacterial EndoU nuclease